MKWQNSNSLLNSHLDEGGHESICLNWRSNLIFRYNGAIDAEDMAFSERSKTHMYALNNFGEVYAPAWYTINLHASYVFSKNILVRGGIDNIMDVQYRGYASGIVAPGRSIFISLRGSI